jgi:hypothetical protein
MRVIIYFEDLTDFHLISLAGICPNLISIDGCEDDSFVWKISTSALREFIKKCPCMEVWRLCSNCFGEEHYSAISNAYKLTLREATLTSMSR